MNSIDYGIAYGHGLMDGRMNAHDWREQYRATTLHEHYLRGWEDGQQEREDPSSDWYVPPDTWGHSHSYTQHAEGN